MNADDVRGKLEAVERLLQDAAPLYGDAYHGVGAIRLLCQAVTELHAVVTAIADAKTNPIDSTEVETLKEELRDAQYWREQCEQSLRDEGMHVPRPDW